LKVNDSISIQDINDPYTPDYSPPSVFLEFRTWFQERIEEQFSRVKEELERIS